MTKGLVGSTGPVRGSNHSPWNDRQAHYLCAIPPTHITIPEANSSPGNRSNEKNSDLALAQTPTTNQSQSCGSDVICIEEEGEDEKDEDDKDEEDKDEDEEETEQHPQVQVQVQQVQVEGDELILQDEYDTSNEEDEDDDEQQSEQCTTLASTGTGIEAGRRCRSEGANAHHSSTKLAASAPERAHSASPYRYRRPDPVMCAESIEVEAILHGATFFLARACKENIRLAKEKSYWTTTPHVEATLDYSFAKSPSVILIFIEKGGRHFCGFARICSKALYRGQPALCWKEFNGGGSIKLQWISQRSLPILATEHLKNAFNHDKPVYMSIDGSKIERSTGQRLCRLFPIDQHIDLRSLGSSVHGKGAGHNGSCKKRPLYDLPSLFDTSITYSQFKKAKRDLTSLEQWDTATPSILYPTATYPYEGQHGTRHRKVLLDEKLRYKTATRPTPLMDLPLIHPAVLNPEDRLESGRSTSYRKHEHHHYTERSEHSYRTTSAAASSSRYHISSLRDCIDLSDHHARRSSTEWERRTRTRTRTGSPERTQHWHGGRESPSSQRSSIVGRHRPRRRSSTISSERSSRRSSVHGVQHSRHDSDNGHLRSLERRRC